MCWTATSRPIVASVGLYLWQQEEASTCGQFTDSIMSKHLLGVWSDASLLFVLSLNCQHVGVAATAATGTIALCSRHCCTTP